MSRFIKWFACVGLAFLVVVVGTLIGINRQVPPEAVVLRERFPYLSLKDRLEFEARSVTGGSTAELVLSEVGLERLQKFERVFENRDSQARLLSLRELHSSEVRWFINSPRNGLSRWGRTPTPDALEYGEPPVIPVLAASAESEIEQSPGTADPAAQDRLEVERVAAIPSRLELEQFHLADQIAFTDPWSFGDVKNKYRVAGFVSHGFTYMPAVGDPQNKYPRAYDPADQRDSNYSSPWKIAQLELVSLLKFDHPAVYVTGHLPRMAEIVDAKTRPLTNFEQQALRSLRGGEDLVTEVDTNEIQMVGSLRSVKQCLECHAGRRGDLLGAFSYRLRRDPPAPVKAPQTTPST